MKKLILLRHAKSSWKDTSLNDHDRPLNSRGKASAPVIGRWLVEREHRPDIVLCSSSHRTCQTARLLKDAMPELPDAIIEDDLYHASPGTMLERLRRLPSTSTTAMIIGHQPGLSTLTRMLADGTEGRRCRRAYEHFPTAAAAVLELACEDWAKLDYQKAQFIDFAKPRELMDA